MKRKVAILTLYYNNSNYGGLLQSFALQQAINKLGYKSVQISYRLETGYPTWNPLKAAIKKPLAYMYHAAKYGRWFAGYNARYTKVDRFAAQIPHTKIVTASTISTLSDSYDYFICGSDQIWNPIGWQPTLFLDSIPQGKRKIAYAASVARENLSREELDTFEKYLPSFYAISVREKNVAQQLNRELPGLNIPTMPDPVFLLQPKDWGSLSQADHLSDKPYIFAYMLGNSIENRTAAIEYADKLGLPIFWVGYMDKAMYKWENEHKECILPPVGVEEFLGYIKNAELVLTDSFHAAAFSIIFETPFFALPRHKRGDVNSMNSRLLNLVDEVGIQDRFAEELKCREKYKWSKNEIESINIALKDMRNKGKTFLLHTLSNSAL